MVLIGVSYFFFPDFFKMNPIVQKIFHEPVKLNIPLEFQKASTLQEQGKYAESIELYKKIIEIEPNNYLATIGLAESYRKIGLFNEAIKAFNKTLSFDNYDYKAFSGLGNSYFDKGDYEQSYYYFNQAYNLKPDEKGITLALLEIMNRIGMYDATIELANLSISKFGETANAYRRMATAYLLKGEIGAAIVYAKKAEKIVEFRGNHLVLGYIYLAMNETQNAIIEFQNASKSRKSISIYEGISLAYLMEGNKEEYLKHKAIASLYQKDSFALSLFGYSMLNLNQFELAIHEFNASIAILPSYYLPYKGMGETLLKTGQKDKAAFYLQKAAELSSFDQETEVLLDEAKKI